MLVLKKTNENIEMDKEYIISEIKRTAKANGGVPLGMGMFEKETGIKKGNWSGKYWVKWSDAIQEAGYKPNKLQQAYDEEWLIERLITLIREKNRYPTKAEIQFKSFNDKSFPHNTTFVNRLGKNKTDIVNTIFNYCKNKKGYEDIVEICTPLLKKEKIEEKHENTNNDEYGFVYLIKSGKFYKIGRTKSTGMREYTLALQLPEKVTKVHEIKTDDPVGIETYWHKRFQDKRKNGEWFELSATDIKIFKRRTFM